MADGSLAELAEAILDDLCASFPLGYRPAIVWKNLRVTAGIAYYGAGSIGLSRIVLQTGEQLRDTLIHEYAHLLAVARHGPKGAGHGPPWRLAMIELGQEPKVRHSYAVRRNEKRQEVGYACRRCGHVVVRTRRLPRGRRYFHVGCGGFLRLSFVKHVTSEAFMA